MEPGPDGWSEVTVRADSEEIAVECVLTLGRDAEVLEPASIRDRVRETAQALLTSTNPSEPTT
jgi:predicted DNA-binding transcriptional regulator YafY